MDLVDVVDAELDDELLEEESEDLVVDFAASELFELLPDEALSVDPLLEDPFSEDPFSEERESVR